MIHALFEQVGWLTNEQAADPGTVLAQAAQACPLPAEQVRPHVGDFERMLGKPAIAEALCRPVAETHEQPPELWRERRFIVTDPDDPAALIEGVFDRVVVWWDKDSQPVRAHVLDYKTDRVPGGQIAERAARYRGQVDAYRRALQAMLGLPAERIAATLLFVEEGVAAAC